MGKKLVYVLRPINQHVLFSKTVHLNTMCTTEEIRTIVTALNSFSLWNSVEKK